MIAQSTRLAAATSSAAVAGISRIAAGAMATAVFKRSPGNSFTSFKEYRENAKTYGPLSASLATRRHLAHTPKL
ncbi:YJL133C-A [Saccharomyces arboricola H-6]|uniref:YJL133C-A n=1 Tax=Saccharomyces arboricola (strain H-6 / AS 2.3317 / CBS 10644) TaxID=1160507 RepID=J8Q6G3_SACAR|nr:YJL133C-A [Saccharomyces arboricola H-6]